MVSFRTVLKSLAPWVVLGSLTLALGCSSGDDPVNPTTPTVTISGTVTYVRVPVAKDAAGVPTGLETDPAKFQTLPVRGALLRVFKGDEQTDANGNKVMVWRVSLTGTGEEGKYSINVEQGSTVFVELASIFQYGSSSTYPSVRILGVPMTSSLGVVDRPLYVLRKQIDGSAVTDVTTPGAMAKINASATVDFAVGLSDRWWLCPASPSQVDEAVQETTGTGSRVVAIVDDLFAFTQFYGNPTPGTITNLHYVSGYSEARGTYMEYDREASYLGGTNFDGSELHYYGAIKGGPTDDDAFDQAVLYEMFTRNRMFVERILPQLPSLPLPADARADRMDLQDLVPDMALVEGFAPGFAACLLKSPYLGDTSTSGAVVRDIRSRAGVTADAYSAPNLAGLLWEIHLKANGVTSPGDPSTWATLDPKAVRRLLTNGFDATTSVTNVTDVPNIYISLERLKAPKQPTDPIDLAAIFTDPVITDLAAPFGITWPRPTTGPEASYLAAWPTDPDLGTNAIPAFTLSMAGAHTDRTGIYPNLSKGEVVYARFQSTRDHIYDLSVQSTPALPSTAQVEVRVNGQTYLIGSTTSPIRMQLPGATYFPIRVRLLSPSVQQPDLTVNLRFAPQN